MEAKTLRIEKATTGAKKRVIAVGKKVNGRWKVRTSLWRYLAATTLSNQ